MSKKNSVPQCSQVGWGEGSVVSNNFPSYLVGKILTIVESFGLRETQEKAAKDIVQQTIYGEFYEAGVLIGTNTHTAIRKKSHELHKENIDMPYNIVEIV